MATKRTPTNTDIYRTLGQIDEKVDQIHTQVRATNGRVTKLEKWKNELDVVEAYKAKNPGNIPKPDEGMPLREKFFYATITALIAIIAALVGVKAV